LFYLPDLKIIRRRFVKLLNRSFDFASIAALVAITPIPFRKCPLVHVMLAHNNVALSI
jgi:hypothetical protein